MKGGELAGGRRPTGGEDVKGVMERSGHVIIEGRKVASEGEASGPV